MYNISMKNFLVLAFLAISIGAFVTVMIHREKTSKKKLTATIAVSPTTVPTMTVPPTVMPTEKKAVLSKPSYRIALFGDSMIDTMVDAPENLETILKATYPKTFFKVYNYGIGGQNISDGLKRWESSFSNRNREYPPIGDVKADVIVIGSFAYNPFNPHDKAKHKEQLTQLVTKAKQTDARVFLLAEIAPLGDDFGKGPKGVNWPPEQSREHSKYIEEMIENTFVVGKELGVPVIDMYSKSKATGSEFGRRELVNIDDGIHPSPEGHALTAEAIFSTINLK